MPTAVTDGFVEELRGTGSDSSSVIYTYSCSSEDLTGRLDGNIVATCMPFSSGLEKLYCRYKLQSIDDLEYYQLFSFMNEFRK